MGGKIRATLVLGTPRKNVGLTLASQPHRPFTRTTRCVAVVLGGAALGRGGASPCVAGIEAEGVPPRVTAGGGEEGNVAGGAAVAAAGRSIAFPAALCERVGNQQTHH